MLSCEPGAETGSHLQPVPPVTIHPTLGLLSQAAPPALAAEREVAQGQGGLGAVAPRPPSSIAGQRSGPCRALRTPHRRSGARPTLRGHPAPACVPQPLLPPGSLPLSADHPGTPGAGDGRLSQLCVSSATGERASGKSLRVPKSRKRFFRLQRRNKNNG